MEIEYTKGTTRVYVKIGPTLSAPHGTEIFVDFPISPKGTPQEQNQRLAETISEVVLAHLDSEARNRGPARDGG